MSGYQDCCMEDKDEDHDAHSVSDAIDFNEMCKASVTAKKAAMRKWCEQHGTSSALVQGVPAGLLELLAPVP